MTVRPLPAVQPGDIAELYALFPDPLAHLDCGQRCAPYNEGGVPFCCDTRHAVPTASCAEWAYLNRSSDLWHLWDPQDQEEKKRLTDETPDGQVLIECLGAPRCQRDFRSVTCRAFPFFPYFDSQGAFLGLAYYQEYRDRCWIISNLDAVTDAYRAQFMRAYERIFVLFPGETANFSAHAAETRRIYAARRRRIPLLHRDGCDYLIRPKTEALQRVDAAEFPKFGVYKLAEFLSFPDE